MLVLVLFWQKQPCEPGPASKLLWPDSRAYRFGPWQGSPAGIPKSCSALPSPNRQRPKRNQSESVSVSASLAFGGPPSAFRVPRELEQSITEPSTLNSELETRNSKL